MFKRGVFSSPGGNELDAKLVLPQLVQMNGPVHGFQGPNPIFQEVILMFMNFLGPGLQRPSLFSFFSKHVFAHLTLHFKHSHASYFDSNEFQWF